MRRLFEWTEPRVRKRWRVLIAVSEIGGGLAGAVMFAADALYTARPAWHTASAMAFCAVSAISGWLLLRKRRGGRGLSSTVQALQVVWLWLPTAAFRITSGLALLLSYDTGRGPDAIVGATTAFRVGLSDPGAGVGAGINFFAIAALMALARLGEPSARDAASVVEAPLSS